MSTRKDRQENSHLPRVDSVFHVCRKDVDEVQKFLFVFDQLQHGSCSFSAVSGRSWFDFEILFTGENQAKKKYPVANPAASEIKTHLKDSFYRACFLEFLVYDDQRVLTCYKSWQPTSKHMKQYTEWNGDTKRKNAIFRICLSILIVLLSRV